MDLTASALTVADQTSREYLGRWNHLISSTNWQKGRIILDWRAALIAAAAPSEEYSDEAWARRVGNVSGQHVGRLRRCAERFGETYGDYRGLYWSHFQAALEWPDAEMWLEGAVQNDWSVAIMRRQRAESYGQLSADVTETEAVAPTEWDEDAQLAGDTHDPQTVAGTPRQTEQKSSSADNSSTADRRGGASGPLHEGPDFGDESFADDSAATTQQKRIADMDSDLDHHDPASLAPQPNTVQRPFAELPPLPDDLSDAFEGLKLAILRHKTTAWEQVEPQAVRAHLTALLALLEMPAA
jgi:hypothetical protein